MRHIWNKQKNISNIRKHGISFEEAVEIFDGLTITRIDDRFDYNEERYISLGCLNNLTIVVVVHVERDEVIRLISARRANKLERKIYNDYLKRTLERFKRTLERY